MATAEIFSSAAGVDALPPFVLAGAGVVIDFDRTLLLQMALFAFLIVVLKPLLLDPVLKVFTLREERTEGARAEARSLQERAGELLRRYESELERVNQVATAERERLRAETAELEHAILEEARRATARMVDDGRRSIQTEVNKIRFELGRESERLGRQMAARVLGREVN